MRYYMNIGGKMSKEDIMTDIEDSLNKLSKLVSGQIDAHLIESIVSLFNKGILVHYVKSPRTSYNSNNYTLTIEAASGVTFEGRERMIELEKQNIRLKKQLDIAISYLTD